MLILAAAAAAGEAASQARLMMRRMDHALSARANHAATLHTNVF